MQLSSLSLPILSFIPLISFICAYHMCIYHSLGLDYPYTTIPSRCVVESILIHPKLIVVYCRVLIRVESCRRPLLLMHAIFCCCNLIRIYHISNAHKLSNTIGDIVYHIDFIIVGFVAVLHIIRLLQCVCGVKLTNKQ